ncbi:MAG: glycoside hydrolase family 9 protein, partial [Oscillospiraceae bacterium]|nr:glycoside hydrolase family 9 protein [Oscillospiraceae bacterium]
QELPGGLRWLTTWGCLRYATTAGFIAAVACDTVLKDSPNVESYKTFYKEQADYCLGNNPDGRAYVVGYNETSPTRPHHRTAHGSWNNSVFDPEDSRHILYGALVGGPTEAGVYEDDRNNYINNEVATDYNAGFTALMCKLIGEYGGKTDPNFPEPEVRTPEYFVESRLKGLDDSGITVSFKFTNHTAWPARTQDNMSFRYYMDISEVLDAGFSASDIAIRCDRNQSTMYGECKPATISEMKQYDGNIYYVEVEIPDGKIAMPISEGRHQCEFLISFVFPNYGSGWDATNDFSNLDGILDTGETSSCIAQNVPVYYNGELVFGAEPDGTKAPDPSTPVKPETPTTTVTTVTTPAPTTTSKTEPTTTTSKPVETTTNKPNDSDTVIYGDLNGDEKTDLTDLTTLSLYLIGDTKLSDSQLKAADVNGDGEVVISDLAHFKQYISKDPTVVLGPQ